MTDAPTKIILVQSEQSLAISAWRDLVSLGGLSATAWFLNTQMPPSAWINSALAIAWILWMIGRGQSLRMTPEQAREHIAALAKEGDR